MTRTASAPETTVTAEPTMSEIMALIRQQNETIAKLVKGQQTLARAAVERVEPKVEPKVEPDEIVSEFQFVKHPEIADLKAWLKLVGRSTAGAWNPTRIENVTAEYKAARKLFKANHPKVEAPSTPKVEPKVEVSGGRFGRQVAPERPKSSTGQRPTRQDAPGLLAQHPYLSAMRKLSSADWIDLSTHGAGERRNAAGKITRKGLPNPTGMTNNWRFIARTMSGTATTRDGDTRERTPNIEFEACNLVQHLAENGKL